MSQEIKDFFMEEAEELFDNLHSILLKNEELGGITPQELDSIFRDIHTLKGGAGSVEMVKFSDFTHHLESFMDFLKLGTLKLDNTIIDFLIERVSMMQTLLQKEYEGSINTAKYEEDLEQLITDIEAIKTGKTATKNVPQKASIAGENAAELLDLFDTLYQKIKAVKEKKLQPQEATSEIFRLVHTLKGAAQFLNLQYFPTYIHEVESLLDKAREGEVLYTDHFNTLMESLVERSKLLVDHELSNNIDDDTFKEQLEELQDELSEFYPQSQKEHEKSEDDSDTFIGFELFDEPTATPEISTTPAEVPVKEEKQDITLNKAASASIRVNLDKIDQLMNRVGDLVITKSMLFQFAESLKNDTIYKAIFEKLSDLDRDIRELQESVMSVRMVPMENVYSRLPKMVRDLAKKLDKKIKFEHFGDSVEIDKMMVEGLMDPLTHIIRNSLDHGIENPKARYKKGKPEVGKLIISAVQESGNIIISIRDDGAGINTEKVAQKAISCGAITADELSRMSEQEKLMLVFHPGLSTAETVTNISGRGVGMDVVMNNINALGGYIKVFSKKDRGTEFKIILPLTLAILDGLNIIIGDKKFILPLNTIVESLQPQTHMIKSVGENDKEILMLRNEFIPIIRLYHFFNITPTYRDLDKVMLIICKTASTKVALFVDDFLNQEQIVVKSLEKNYKKIQGIGAATIRGDGSIGLILDVVSIVDREM
jgi:two-component system chemotaxis sensor kinase CheA